MNPASHRAQRDHRLAGHPQPELRHPGRRVDPLVSPFLVPPRARQLDLFSGTTIYDRDRERLSRIYDAAIASNAVYTLSEHLFGHDDPHAVMARDLLAARYKIHKQNFWDFSPIDHPRDSILLEPEDENGFYVFAVKATATAQDWIDDFDAGRAVSGIDSHRCYA